MKFKNLLNNKKNNVIILILIFLWSVIFFWYTFIIEKININSDEYNFQQFEKIKSILEWEAPTEYKFWNLQEFNEKYNSDITPQNNCYFLIDRNRKYDTFDDDTIGYTFAFELLSLKYNRKYNSDIYIYPSYNLPKTEICPWGYCYDTTSYWFSKIISNTCLDKPIKYFPSKFWNIK